MATQKELNVTMAYFDYDGWVLSNADTDCIEEWPSDWPEAVDSAFLREHGVEIH